MPLRRKEVCIKKTPSFTLWIKNINIYTYSTTGIPILFGIELPRHFFSSSCSFWRFDDRQCSDKFIRIRKDID